MNNGSQSLKSMAVLSPAGSGKTERLARRYIELLKKMQEPKPERILTVTFTRKAAAEMKERIFRILKKEDPGLLQVLKNNILRLRIMTIDAFCLSLLQRFALRLGLEPELDVLADPNELWALAQYDTMMKIAEAGRRDRDFAYLLDQVTEGRMSGWQKMSEGLDSLYQRRAMVGRATMPDPDFDEIARLGERLRSHPLTGEKLTRLEQLFPERFNLATCQELVPVLAEQEHVFLAGPKNDHKPRSQTRKPELHEWYEQMYLYWGKVLTACRAEEFKCRFDLFRRRFLSEFNSRKGELGRVDFTDLELFAYHLLTRSDDWSNILLAFDEHTDHVLVDEFQDTSFLQWGIIDKLTEEWRAGLGRKQAQGVEPTIFIVGDDKQSIYLFRNAHAEVFGTVRDRLERWLGPERFEFLQVKDNFRSLSSIIDFTNHVFAQLMKPGPDPKPWQTQYGVFTRERKNTDPGGVELILGLNAGKMEERRAREAALIARRIQGLVGVRNVEEDGKTVPCSFKHIAVLLRSKTHLRQYEEAFSRAGIRYLVLGGTGFYEEPEVRFLMNLLAVLIDPADDFALYVLLKSPFFAFPEKDLFMMASQAGATLLEKLASLPESSPGAAAIGRIRSWLEQAPGGSLAGLIARILEEQEAWQSLWEPQRVANVRKFLRVLEQAESSGMSPLRIREMFDRAAGKTDRSEPKATVDARGQDAVQIMTIHSAKGLQFPIVFCPELDRQFSLRVDEQLVEETSPEQVRIVYQPDSGLRKSDPMFREYVEKEREEEKRVFYVACTRARDALFLSGLAEKAEPQESTCFRWLWETLDLRSESGQIVAGAQIPGVALVVPAEMEPVPEPGTSPTKLAQEEPPDFRGEVSEPSRKRVCPVTRDTRSDRRRHGDDAIAFGVVMHAILESISLGRLVPDNEGAVVAEARRLFGLEGAGEELCERHCRGVTDQLCLMREQGLLEIVLPQANSYTELPFLLRQGSSVLSGRIDRLVLHDETVDVYDYKTFPVKESELPALVEEYRESQMRFYVEAAGKLFPDRKARGFLLFTATPRLVPV